MSKIIEIDYEPVLKRMSLAINPRLHLEAYKARITKRIENGEHIHLYHDIIEECLNAGDQCWEGPRERKRT